MTGQELVQCLSSNFKGIKEICNYFVLNDKDNFEVNETNEELDKFKEKMKFIINQFKLLGDDLQLGMDVDNHEKSYY